MPPLALAPAPKRFIFKDVVWLGASHDGYQVAPLSEYMKVRAASLTGSNESLYERAALLQSLYTFGLLESVMEIAVPESKLLRTNNDGEVVMTCENLPALLQDWRYRIRQLQYINPSQCQQWASRVEKTLTHTYRLLHLEIMHPQHSAFFLSRLALDKCSAILNVVGCIAEAVTSSRCVFMTTGIASRGFSWNFALDIANRDRKEMVARGWCPFTVRILSGEACVLAYASTRPPFIQDSINVHHNCTNEACIIHTIDAATYINKHVTTACICAYSKPPTALIMDILKDVKVPVVHLVNGELCACEASQMSYVAVSHVWSDGLGSTTEIGLPACQIARVAELVRRLLPSGAFWMDALCVPEKREMRKQAIGLMAETYRRAEIVLVIDSGIRSCPVSSPLEEKLLRVLSSGWMQRLWTLQEGLLAQTLFFEFADGQLVSLDRLIPVGDELMDPLLMGLACEIFRLTKYRKQESESNSAVSIGDIGRALRWRTTSKLEDETLAISGLLNVNAFELVNTPPQKRMAAFLLKIQRLPSNIIFTLSPKLREPGFGWAPKTLMLGSTASMAVGKPDAICTSQGLIAEYAAVYFKSTSVNNYEQWFLCDNSKQRFYQVTDVSECPSSPEPYTCDVLLLMSLPAPSELLPCVAVAVIGPCEELDGTTRFKCEFRRRLLLKDISRYELKKENVKTDIVDAKSGRMKVLMV